MWLSAFYKEGVKSEFLAIDCRRTGVADPRGLRWWWVYLFDRRISGDHTDHTDSATACPTDHHPTNHAYGLG